MTVEWGREGEREREMERALRLFTTSMCTFHCLSQECNSFGFFRRGECCERSFCASLMETQDLIDNFPKWDLAKSDAFPLCAVRSRVLPLHIPRDVEKRMDREPFARVPWAATNPKPVSQPLTLISRLRISQSKTLHQFFFKMIRPATA